MGSKSHEAWELEDLDYGPCRKYHGLQLDVALTDVEGRPPPPAHVGLLQLFMMSLWNKSPM